MEEEEIKMINSDRKEIYTQEREGFFVGICIAENVDYSIYKCVDEFGGTSGYYVINNSIITHIEEHTDYLQKIKKYMEYNRQHSYKKWFSLPEFPVVRGCSLLEQALKYSHEGKIIVSIASRDQEELDTGYICFNGDNTIDMETIDLETAQTMGKINIRIDNIDVLEFNSLENTLLQYAHEN